MLDENSSRVDKPPLLECRNIKKSFAGNEVLKDINFKLEEGEVLGLVGENGAGKSTLMNIIFAMNEIFETGGFEGEVLMDGKRVNFKSSHEALENGLGMVHQEFSLLNSFTAWQNIVLNRESCKKNFLSEVFGSRLNFIDVKTNKERADRAITKLGVNLDKDMMVSQMPVGYKQFTEIARELSRKGIRILLLDEPTAVLSETEAENLLKAIRELKKKGIAIIFITHRLQEIIDVCDKIIVMRDGRIVSDIRREDADINSIAKAMVGREVKIKSNSSNENRKISNENIMSIKHLYCNMPGEIVHDVSLDIRKGEILGIAGLAGQGKLGIANGILNIFPNGGEINFKGTNISKLNTKERIKKGISFVSEDRRGVGLLLDESLEWNISFLAMQVKKMFLKKYSFVKFRDQRAIERATQKYIQELSIKCTSSKQKAGQLSGGNQQKVCLAKAFCMSPELLFVAEATRGIDIGAKALVLDSLRKYNRDYGTTIVMISSELEELRSICDRIAVITDGKVAGIRSASAPSEEFALLMVSAIDIKEAR